MKVPGKIGIPVLVSAIYGGGIILKTESFEQN